VEKSLEGSIPFTPTIRVIEEPGLSRPLRKGEHTGPNPVYSTNLKSRLLTEAAFVFLSVSKSEPTTARR